MIIETPCLIQGYSTEWYLGPNDRWTRSIDKARVFDNVLEAAAHAHVMLTEGSLVTPFAIVTAG